MNPFGRLTSPTRRSLLGAAACTLVPPAFGQVSRQRRVALLIGNKDYLAGPQTPNALNDVADMASFLLSAGFEPPMVARNASIEDMRKAFAQWRLAHCEGADVRLFYFSGHGSHFRGSDYLLGIDGRLDRKQDVTKYGLDTEQLAVALAMTASRPNAGVRREGSRTHSVFDGGANIVLVDACRTPAEIVPRGPRNPQEDLARAVSRPPSGAIIGFASQKGSEALDNRGERNSVYTSYLLHYLKKPGLSIEQVLRLTQQTVYERQGDKQHPDIQGNLLGRKLCLVSAADGYCGDSPPPEPGFRLEFGQFLRR
jgi:uncharacterized caspase-like protein